MITHKPYKALGNGLIVPKPDAGHLGHGAACGAQNCVSTTSAAEPCAMLTLVNRDAISIVVETKPKERYKLPCVDYLRKMPHLRDHAYGFG
jgi:hypothetical protein